MKGLKLILTLLVAMTFAFGSVACEKKDDGGEGATSQAATTGEEAPADDEGEEAPADDEGEGAAEEEGGDTNAGEGGDTAAGEGGDTAAGAAAEGGDEEEPAEEAASQ